MYLRHLRHIEPLGTNHDLPYTAQTFLSQQEYHCSCFLDISNYCIDLHALSSLKEHHLELEKSEDDHDTKFTLIRLNSDSAALFAFHFSFLVINFRSIPSCTDGSIAERRRLRRQAFLLRLLPVFDSHRWSSSYPVSLMDTNFPSFQELDRF